ncbi:MAG: hypothetical protein ACK5V3_02175 [Bdellovibrionales bacterium]
MTKKLYSTVFLLFLMPQFVRGERFQVGLGIAQQRLNTKSFQNSVDESKGHFDFTSFELRGAYSFVSLNLLTLSLEGHYHRSLESQSSITGYIDFEEFAFSSVANITVWTNFGLEAGATFFSLVTSPKKDMENPGGIGLLYGLTYLINKELQLRIRREDKVLANSYDIQPGYSFSISYLFK